VLVLLLGGLLIEQGPFSALATAHPVACDVDAAAAGGVLMCTPMRVHGAARLMARHRLLPSVWAVVVDLELRAEVLGVALVLDCGRDIAERAHVITLSRAVLCVIGGVGDMVLVQALALVAASALGGRLPALRLRGAVVDELEVRVSVRAGLVDDGATDGRGFL
jgi:hypothetical protein